MRTMKLEHKHYGTLYESAFDEKTGALVRVISEPDDYYWSLGDHDEALAARYKHRQHDSTVFSPVPETVDISITDRCSMGCSYCYQDSRPKRDHAPKELVETVLRGFNQPPYQIAIGGGEPTQHPDFANILRTAREIGTVPNYTTAGHAMTDEIIEATNEVAGGVALTFHAFKGLDWFAERYTELRRRLKVQLNVHLIADRDVAVNMAALTSLCERTGPLNLVLLAFYPDVGRSSLDGIMTKRAYMDALPLAINAAQRAGTKIAFSEGLLPYFLSRPELGVETKYAMWSEGRFSCYFDPAGRISESSFKPPYKDGPTVFDVRSQVLWDEASFWRNGPRGDACYGCEKRTQCATPHEMHLFTCAYQSHNTNRTKESP